MAIGSLDTLFHFVSEQTAPNNININKKHFKALLALSHLMGFVPM
jgi:hypothetical protein